MRKVEDKRNNSLSLKTREGTLNRRLTKSKITNNRTRTSCSKFQVEMLRSSLLLCQIGALSLLAAAKEVLVDQVLSEVTKR